MLLVIKLEGLIAKLGRSLAKLEFRQLRRVLSRVNRQRDIYRLDS